MNTQKDSSKGEVLTDKAVEDYLLSQAVTPEDGDFRNATVPYPSAYMALQMQKQALSSGKGEVLYRKEDVEMKDFILSEYKKGNIVIASEEGLLGMPLVDFVKQPAEFMLYDLNRCEAVVLTFINDPKWVNDYACAKVIKELKRQLDVLNQGTQTTDSGNV